MSNKEIQNICVILLIFMSIATFPVPYDYYKLLRIISSWALDTLFIRRIKTKDCVLLI